MGNVIATRVEFAPMDNGVTAKITAETTLIPPFGIRHSHSIVPGGFDV